MCCDSYNDNNCVNTYVYSWNTADLLVATPLDYETSQKYSFVIQVSDGEFVSLPTTSYKDQPVLIS